MATATAPKLEGTYRDYHSQVFVPMAERGELTILDLMDSIPWANQPGTASWTPWRSFLKAYYALKPGMGLQPTSGGITSEEEDIYHHCTQRQRLPETAPRYAWLICGRRARKSAIVALIAIWETLFRDYTGALAPGEHAITPVLAKSKLEARQIHDHAVAILESSEQLSLMLERTAGDDLWLTNGSAIRVVASNSQSGRSKAAPCICLDEFAHFPKDTSANPDREIIRALEPTQATFKRPKFIGLSSPYIRRGVLYEKYRDYFGKEDSPELVWKADSVYMHDHPQVKIVVEEAYRDDPIGAACEYGAEFRTDRETFVTQEVLEACTVKGTHEIPPAHWEYFAFVDPAGGSGSDSMTLGIAHAEPGNKLVLDLLREWEPPFSTDDAAIQITETLSEYRLKAVRGDRAMGDWVRNAFRRAGVQYWVSKADKSQIYRDTLPLLNTGRVQLLDIKRLRNQLELLERRVSDKGHETINHPDGGHDDLANVACGALRLADREGTRHKFPYQPQPAPETLQDAFMSQIWQTVRKPKRKAGDPWRA